MRGVRKKTGATQGGIFLCFQFMLSPGIPPPVPDGQSGQGPSQIPPTWQGASLIIHQNAHGGSPFSPQRHAHCTLGCLFTGISSHNIGNIRMSLGSVSPWHSASKSPCLTIADFKTDRRRSITTANNLSILARSQFFMGSLLPSMLGSIPFRPACLVLALVG